MYTDLLMKNTKKTSKKKKKFGQFFTEMPVANLLSALAFSKEHSSVIDPMAGSGNLLKAVAFRAKHLGVKLRIMKILAPLQYHLMGNGP